MLPLWLQVGQVPLRAQPAPQEAAGPPQKQVPLPAQPAPQKAAGPVAEDEQVQRVLGTPEELVTARQDRAVPTGSISVLVLDEGGAPLEGTLVELAILKQDQTRDYQRQKSGADGRVLWSKLRTGTGQAYRVNLRYPEGAKVGSRPFRLPQRGTGFSVRATRLPTSDRPAHLMALLHHTVVEPRDKRLRISQQVQLVNLARTIHVLPRDGLRFQAPQGATGFNFERAMTDQTAALLGEHIALEGSLSPGRTNVVWSFDVPFSQSKLDLVGTVPLPTFMVRVEVAHVEGMGVRVPGAPPAQVHEGQQGKVRLIQWGRQKEPGNLGELVIKLSGLPGPGPFRWIALALSLLLITLVIALRLRRPDPSGKTEASAETEHILSQIRTLSRERNAGEVGPQYYETKKTELIEQLAWHLAQRDRAQRNPRGESAITGH